MWCTMSVKCVRGCKAALIGLTVLVLLGPGSLLKTVNPATAETVTEAPIEISGQYSIYFNGFDIGSVRIDQRTAGRTYSASSQVQISALLGAFRWKGVTRSAGTMNAGTLSPSGYDFQYEGTSKSGSVRIGFAKGSVTSLTALPETIDPPDLVPLRPADIKSVIDPLSAVVAVSRPAARPCGRNLAIFDGKQRFDIALIETRREAVSAGRNDTTVQGIVCRVKYTPVAGYRANDDTEALAASTAIEVTFRPVAEAGIWAPYRVAIPTIAGTVALEATRYDINAPGLAQIALVD